MSPQHSLSEFVKAPQVSTAALHLEWHEVRRRVRRHRQVRVAGTVVAALVVAGVVAGLALRTPREPFAAGELAVAQETSRTLGLAEGSEVVVSPGGSLELAKADDTEVVFLLQRGRASFDVQKKPSRRFVVKADAVEVRVVGTKFTVQREGPQVEVSVQRGIVEVREGEVVKRLVAGEHWTRVAAPEPEERGEADEEDLSEPPSPTRSTPVRHKRNLRTSPNTAQTPAAPAATTGGTEPLPPLPTTTALPTPADHFAAAMSARAAGRDKEAILGFQQVCERWPSSAYAPMSAFEWGRLALDTEDDPRQAARAFERTLELATSASLIEDALARLTEAYARYDAGSCRRVQAEYLRRFPAGSHVRGVTKACPP